MKKSKISLTQKLYNFMEPSDGFTVDIDLNKVSNTFDNIIPVLERTTLIKRKDKFLNNKNNVIIFIKLFLEEYYGNFIKKKEIKSSKANYNFSCKEIDKDLLDFFHNSKINEDNLLELLNSKNFIDYIKMNDNKNTLPYVQELKEKLPLIQLLLGKINDHFYEKAYPITNISKKKKIPDIFLEEFVRKMAYIYLKYIGKIKGKYDPKSDKYNSNFLLFCSAFFEILVPSLKQLIRNKNFAIHLTSIVKRFTEIRNRRNKKKKV